MFVKTVIEADDGRVIAVLTMGPICITPELKRRGYGKKLLDYSLEKAAAMGFGAVLFEGNIGFYGKSGFDYARNFGIHTAIRGGLRVSRRSLPRQINCRYHCGAKIYVIATLLLTVSAIKKEKPFYRLPLMASLRGFEPPTPRLGAPSAGTHPRLLKLSNVKKCLVFKGFPCQRRTTLVSPKWPLSGPSN